MPSSSVKLAALVARQAAAGDADVRQQVAALKRQVAILQQLQERSDLNRARGKMAVEGMIVIVSLAVTMILIRVQLGWIAGPVGVSPAALQVALERVWRL